MIMTLPNTSTPIASNPFSQQSIIALNLCEQIERRVKAWQPCEWIPTETIADIRSGLPCKLVLKHIIGQCATDRGHVEAFFGTELLGKVFDYVNSLNDK